MKPIKTLENHRSGGDTSSSYQGDGGCIQSKLFDLYIFLRIEDSHLSRKVSETCAAVSPYHCPKRMR